MVTLHIEHAITDFAVWHEAFCRFAQIRQAAGVTSERVSQPFDDDRYVVIGLEFDDIERAVAFQAFLHTQIWSTPANSPALAGDPRTAVLVPAVGSAACGNDSQWP